MNETDYWEPCSVCMKRKENEDDGELYCDDVLDQFSTRFGHLLKECEPSFPALTSLESCEPPLRRLLGVFAASLITSLVLSRLCFNEPRDGDLSTFRFLRSLSIPILLTMDKDKITYFIKVLSTIRSGLQHLSLVMNLSKDLPLRFSRLPFANSLISLTLEGEHQQYDVEHLLQLFPNLQILSVCAIFSEPIFSVSKLIDEYHRAHTAQILPPLNTSLSVLEVYGKQYFLDYYVWSSTPMSKRLMAPELNHYRGIPIGLVCRLPALDTLRVGAQFVKGVNESIGAIVDTNVGQEYIDRLKRPRVRPLDY
ncbi:hypothetical protein GGI17_005988 [Coemansia sp. S146]|nr:hypothetical protein GGI17_005988 [Coemansia sp. S146]